MAYVPGKSRTKVVPEGRRFQARYYDAEMRLWFDLGDPKDTEAEARALIRTLAEERPSTPRDRHRTQGYKTRREPDNG